ncbi:hypothetical protein NH340_JMT07666 [Sarcoptes scabiei]|nr:hypothetical protein NH340_JMT07666 [Sarcoptes scabiei]
METNHYHQQQQQERKQHQFFDTILKTITVNRRTKRSESMMNPSSSSSSSSYSTRSNPEILILDLDEDLNNRSNSSGMDNILLDRILFETIGNDSIKNSTIGSDFVPKSSNQTIPMILSATSTTTTTTSTNKLIDFFGVLKSTSTPPSSLNNFIDNIEINLNTESDADDSGTPSIYFGVPICFSSPEDYDLFWSMLCSSFLVVAIVYLTYGYRCFRALSFFMATLLGAILFHTICTAESIQFISNDFIPYGSHMLALMAGILFGIITMLVFQLGLFVIGLHFGLLMAITILFVIYLLQSHYEILQTTTLSPLTLIIFFLTLSLLGVLLTIYHTKGSTILSSSMYGSALLLLCSDYFIEQFRLIHWFFDHLSHENDWYGLLNNLKRNQNLCLESYSILILWPTLTIFGVIIQWLLTAKHFHHLDSRNFTDRIGGGYGVVDETSSSSLINNPNNFGYYSKYYRKSFNGSDTKMIRNQKGYNSHHPHQHHHQQPAHHYSSNSVRMMNLDEQRLDQRNRKYRYLYQIRTAHGDVISQHFLQSLEGNNKKLYPPPDQSDSYTFNSEISSHFLPSESRTTTLTVT